VVPFYFLNRGVHLFCDPHMVGGLAEFCTDLGMAVRLSVVAGRKENAPEPVREGKTAAAAVVFEPVLDGLHGLIEGAGARRGDLVVGDGECVRMLRRRFPAVEFGVPSYTHHVFADTPFLGFEGALRLANRMANAVSAVQN
jgi:nitrogenase molybdenum-iron protein alpha/beta subunit